MAFKDASSHAPALVAFGLGAVALCIVGLALLFASPVKAPTPTFVEPAVPVLPSPAPISGPMTVVGMAECLPHRDVAPGQPITMECAFGIKADDGAHYAVDLAGTGEGAMDFQVGKRVRLVGTMVPVEALSSDHWRTYDIRGIMSATSLEDL